jgi:integrase
MKTATVTLFFDQRRGHNSIKFLITFERKQRLYATGYTTDPETWERLKREAGKDKPNGSIKDEKFIQLWAKFWNDPDKFDKEEPLGKLLIARKIANQLGVNFDFDAFKDAFDNWGKDKPADDTDDVFAALKVKADAMRKADRIGNASNYDLAAKSLGRYVESMDNPTRKDLGLPLRPKAKKKNEEVKPTVLQFCHITPEFLTDYENWMQQYGKTPQTTNPKKGNTKATAASLTTVGIYLRHLRAVVNDAIESGILPREAYPFGHNRYVIPAGQNVKKALSKEDVAKILHYECQNDAEQRARDLWVFSYLSNGMNLADVCALRWSDLDPKANKLNFVRKKTARSKKGNQSKIVAKLFDESWAIIERQGNTDKRPTAYVFPFFDASMDAKRQKAVIHQVIKTINKWMQRIGQTLGIDGDTNSYSARHSFATILLQSDAPLAFISQSLGHTNLNTTQSYLGRFDDEKTKSYLDALL